MRVGSKESNFIETFRGDGFASQRRQLPERAQFAAKAEQFTANK